MPLVLAIAVPAIVVAVALRVAGGVVFRRQPQAKRWVDQYALWSAIPLTLLVLAFLAWPLAIGFAVAGAIVLLVVRNNGAARRLPAEGSTTSRTVAFGQNLADAASSAHKRRG